MKNLLESTWGRTFVFFVLYVNEGIPDGFTAVAIATLLRQEGFTPEVIGWFVGLQYFPWSFKWLAGPFIDLYTWPALGKRRFWILLAQVTAAQLKSCAITLS